nr:transcription-repair coupling factor [bacterium]
VHVGRPPVSHDKPRIQFQSHPLPSFLNRVDDLAARLRELLAADYSVHLLCDNNGQQERLEDILESAAIDLSALRFSLGSVQRGFQLDDLKLAVFTDHEIFDRRKPRRMVRRFKKGALNRSELQRLSPGDHIAHIKHGIGIFSGVTRIKVLDHEREVIRINYADSDTLYVPVENLDEITKYSGPEGAIPRVHKLGSPEWERTRSRTKAKLQEIARELIELYARRKMVRGVRFDPDTVWQKEMEASFEFDEADDQLEAINCVKQDMEIATPMDRLICGDVGYGKTEVAIRAAFKAVMNGRQVAVLVPTTILAQQHYRTFHERIRAFPLKLEVLSRFRSRAEQADTLHRLAGGGVDIVVGTHRLLSKDVIFKNLGLLIVDEEQRFGVLHKEKIKQLATSVDCLTMTATPIPRTLHMALMGARDLSNINTPPVNRLPIETTVAVFNKRLIADAIQQEISRGGQVYFVHNRVQSIHSVKHMLQRMMPELRIAIGHGQMKGSELDAVMLGFMNKDFDVLVSTMIIENGLDIPNVNTLIVNRADRQGLSQLYQLRGRIGRSHRQAYAVFLIPPRHTLNRVALKRLDTIEEFSDLGAGFEIARRDLEIRGAGNLLGKAQTGFLTTLGYDMYNRILEEAVAELKGVPLPGHRELEVTVQLPRDAFFPAMYISDPTERINLYRQLNEIRSTTRLAAYRSELRDRFGPLPEEAELLILIFNIRLLAQRQSIARIEIAELGTTFPLPGGGAEGIRTWMQKLGKLDGGFDIQLNNASPPQLTLATPSTDWQGRCNATIEFLKALPQ